MTIAFWQSYFFQFHSHSLMQSPVSFRSLARLLRLVVIQRRFTQQIMARKPADIAPMLTHDDFEKSLVPRILVVPPLVAAGPREVETNAQTGGNRVCNSCTLCNFQVFHSRRQ
jgi:hypothetical protein